MRLWRLCINQNLAAGDYMQMQSGDIRVNLPITSNHLELHLKFGNNYDIMSLLSFYEALRHLSAQLLVQGFNSN